MCAKAEKTAELYALVVLRCEAGNQGLAQALLDRTLVRLRQLLGVAPVQAEVIALPIGVVNKQQAPYRGHVVFCLTETQARLAGGDGTGASRIASAVVKTLIKPAEELAIRCLGGAVAELKKQDAAPRDLLSNDPDLRPKENLYGYMVDYGSVARRAAAAQQLVQGSRAGAIELMYGGNNTAARPVYSTYANAQTRLSAASVGMTGLSSWGEPPRHNYWGTPSLWRGILLGLAITDGHLEEGSGAYSHGMQCCDADILLGGLHDMRVLHDKDTKFEAVVKHWKPLVATAGSDEDRLPLLQFQLRVKCKEGFEYDTTLQEMVPWGHKTSLFKETHVEAIR